MNRRSFIKNLALFSGVTFLAMDKYMESTNSDKIQLESPYVALPYVGHIEIHLVEHCNLNCKYCSHFGSIAEKKFYDIQKFEKDVARLAYVTKGRIKEIQLLGGEPLLHPDLAQFFYITRSYFPNSHIDILTNGILLNTMKNEFWQACNYNNIYIVPSLYPIKRDWKPIFDKANKYNVKIATDGNSEELNINNIHARCFDCFYKLKIDPKGRNNYITRFKECNYHVTNFINGKVYQCFVASNIKHFNKRFKQNIPITDKDYINIYKTDNIQELLDFLGKPTPFCKYCGAFEFNKPWQVGNQDISEWT